MNRVWDYAGFVVWFSGLGYILLWLVGAPKHGMLPPALHLIGLAAACFVAVRLLLLAIARWRVPPGAASMAGPPETALPPRPPPRPLPTVKPRNHFGLRDTPR